MLRECSGRSGAHSDLLRNMLRLTPGVLRYSGDAQATQEDAQACSGCAQGAQAVLRRAPGMHGFGSGLTATPHRHC